jgi:radical SAM superfamily enzyme YgiQ (UPF0313 family)
VITIYLADLYHDYLPTRQHVPLGIGYIGSYLASRFPSDVSVKLFKSVEKLLDAIALERPDLIGLSNYTWNQNLNKFAGKLIKEAAGDIPIFMGGPNIRIDSRGIADFLAENPYVDKYILFAGERPTEELVREFLRLPHAGRNGKDLRGLDVVNSYALIDKMIVGRTQVAEERELDYCPSPYLNGMLDEFLDEGFLPIVETNRGCPFSCTFCVWGISALSKIKTFSMERISRELEYIAGSGRQYSDIVFADANFGILKRDVDIAAQVRHLHDKYASFQSVVIYWSKSAQPHMVDIGRILGKLTHTYVAFQSLDPIVLEAIKRKNISTDKLVNLIRELRPYTHSTQTDLLVGLPNEDFDSHIRSLEAALKYGINMIFGGEIRMLPGSEMDTVESREKYAIHTKYRLCEGQYGKYRGEFVFELEEVIRQTSTMSEEDMLKLRALRAIFFASVTLGEHRPLISYLVSRGFSVVELFKRLVEPNREYPAFDKSLAWCNELASSEWFASEAAAKNYLSISEHSNALFGGGAFLKLNYGLLGRLLSNPDEYRDFCRKTEDAVLAIAVDEDPQTIREIVGLCTSRNYISNALSDFNAAPNRVLLSRKTKRVLGAAGYLNPADAASANSDWIELSMPDATEQMLASHLRKFAQNRSVLNMSQLLERFRGRTYLEAPNSGELHSSMIA